MMGKLSIKIQIMPFLLVLDKGQLNGIFAVHYFKTSNSRRVI